MSVQLLDSITDAGPDALDRVAISGSHGGIYPAAFASQAGLRAVAFNDAGVGCQQAGVAGVLALAEVGMAAIAGDCRTCRIGDAADLLEHGRVSTANAIARDLGVEPGQSVQAAMQILANAPQPTGTLLKVAEARRSFEVSGAGPVELLDSASLVTPDDAGRIVITGSHGALIGGNPARALKAAARIAVFNDAGVGIDGIGITRLPALESRGVAAVTVDADTARIGDAASALATGVISFANPLAQALGAGAERPLGDWLAALG